MNKKLFLLTVWKDVEPSVADFETDEARVAEAKRRRVRSDEDGLYRLDVHILDGDVAIQVGTFSGAELES